jgi:peptidoglycan/LPS O-acetylase OafA/YrhL
MSIFTVHSAAENGQSISRQLAEDTGKVRIDKTPFNIPSLDGIRAFAFLIVFTAHAGLGNYIPGHLGLSLFFFLSGFLITTLLRIEFERTGTVSLKQFYLRRALRILPPFYLVLFMLMLLTYIGVNGSSLRFDAVMMQIFHLTNYQVIRDGWWNGMAAGTWVYWSLAVEEHFYLGFPLLYLWLLRRGGSGRDQATILILFCVFVLAWRCVLIYYFDAPRDRTYVATDTRIDSILAGCVLAIWGNPVLDREGPSDKKLSLFWLPIGIAAVVLSLLPRIHEYDQTLRYTLQSFGLAPFFVAAIRWHDRGVFRILNLPLIRYLGVLSYSLYLMHVSMLWMLEFWVPWPVWIRGIVAFVVLIGLAALINHYVERPCARIRRRLSRYLESPAPATKI